MNSQEVLLMSSKTPLCNELISLGILSVILLSGCSEAVKNTPGVSDSNVAALFTAEGISNVSVLSHNTEQITGSGYGSQYTTRDTVTVTYNVNGLNGLLPQTVTKDLEFYQAPDASSWEMLHETLTKCEADSSAFPGSSWRCDSLDSGTLEALFGGEIPAGDTGKVYFRFLKTMGLFAFNLSNDKNTSSERFFETSGTKARFYWTGSSGIIGTSAIITGGSVSDSGNLVMDFQAGDNCVQIVFGTDAVSVPEQEFDVATGREVPAAKVYMDSLPVFEVTTTSIENGEWKRETGLKEGNLSPELTWQPVDGAKKYAILMIDTTTSDWLAWGMITDKTHLEEGEFSDTSVYKGPYPPGVHTYELYVIALSGDPKNSTFEIDAQGEDINGRLTTLNTATDGSTGIVLAYGTISAPYTPPELYYGYR